MKNVPIRDSGHIFHVQCEGQCANTKNMPLGRVFCVQHKGWGEEAAEHQKHTYVGMFLMFGVVGEPSDMKNMSRRMYSSCLVSEPKEDWLVDG